MSSTCLLFVEKLEPPRHSPSSNQRTEKMQKEKKSVKQNNSLAIKQSQGPLVPLQGLQIIF